MTSTEPRQPVSASRPPRVFVNQTLIPGGRCRLDAAASHHLHTVLRRDRGAVVEVFNGDGQDYRARIAATGKQLELSIESAAPNRAESPLESILIQGISRGDRMDTTIRMSVELGVSRILPAYTRNAIGILDARRTSRKRTHWQSIAISAAEQSGRARIPLVGEPAPLIDVLKHQMSSAGTETRLTLSPSAHHPLTSLAGDCRALTLLVGPESGLTEAEIDDATQAGFKPVNLGPRTLRTETAAPAALAIIQSRCGDMRSAE